jgi:MATE family multidrug resistance protein
MNAAMLGGNLAGFYVFLLMEITGITEILVGQYHSVGKYDKIAAPVWQMIYLVMFAAILDVPIGYFSKYLNLIPECYAKDRVAHQQLLTYFCWMPELAAAFMGFFIGRGQIKNITTIVIIGNLLNAVLDYLLIFGFRGIIPSLAVSFWSPKNRQHFNTAKNCRFDKKLLGKCLKIGLPMSFRREAELLSWYLVFAAVSHVSRNLAIIHGIARTVYVLIAFICDSFSKGIPTISANFIRENNLTSIGIALKKLRVITLIMCFVFVPSLVVSPRLLYGIHPCRQFLKYNSFTSQ